MTSSYSPMDCGQVLRQLRTTYPEQFVACHLDIRPVGGWLPIFAHLCIATSRLPENAGGHVQWLQIKAKLGSLRVHYGIAPGLEEAAGMALHEMLSALREQARCASETTCEVCGQAAQHISHPLGMTLCASHRARQIRNPAGFAEQVRQQISAEITQIALFMAERDRLMADPFDLARFVRAQQGMYVQVLEELRQGRKQTHWMWFVFPILRGLRPSARSRFFGIRSLVEAQAYTRHPVLGPRLVECVQALLAHAGKPVAAMLGPVDASKLHACLTLFAHATPTEPVFTLALARLFADTPDSEILRPPSAAVEEQP